MIKPYSPQQSVAAVNKFLGVRVCVFGGGGGRIQLDQHPLHMNRFNAVVFVVFVVDIVAAVCY